VKRWLGLILVFPLAALAEDEKKTDKKPIETFTEVSKAGADFGIQGEYAGGKFGVQVIADGDGEFTMKGYHGGLPGAGWDGEKKGVKTWKGKLEDGAVKFGDGEAKAVIAGGKVQVTTGDREMTLERVVRRSSSEGAKPPEGAAVLFDRSNLDQWTKSDGETPPTWAVEGGAMRVNGGDIHSKAKFAGPHAIHVEFLLPFMPRARGQGRANSGVYLQNRYELQVLDSFGLDGKNNESGGFYQLHDPTINMCLPPLQWQTYDIDFTPAKYEDGKKVANARATVKHNGVVVQNDVELKGPTGGGAAEEDTGGGIRLQDHGNPLMFRNIWVVEKK